MKTPLTRRIWAWAFYDFANSAFATTVLAVVFNVYFAQQVVPPEGARWFGRTVSGAALWSFVASFSMFILFFMAPLLGTIADLSGSKKKFLRFFWIMGSLASLGLFWVKPGSVMLAVLLFTLANMGFAGGNVFYNALLPTLGPRRALGGISGFGWAVGYVGGALCLALNLLMIQRPALFGFSTEHQFPVRAALFSVGIWWLVFGAPLLLPRSDEAAAPRRSLLSWTGLAWGRLWTTFRNVRSYKNLLLFILSYAVYNDGIETIILTASVVGAELLHMSPAELIQCFLMIQAVAFVGALGFGVLADRWRHKTVIGLTLIVYVGVVLWAARMTSRTEFWILGAVLGLVLGGSQAASRSFMGALTPPEQSGEFFGFYGVVGKLTAVAGPFVFGAVSQGAGLRYGILSLLVFFLVGGVILLFVEENAPLRPEL
jgi:UMF1 family MFS transporter